MLITRIGRGNNSAKIIAFYSGNRGSIGKEAQKNRYLANERGGKNTTLENPGKTRLLERSAARKIAIKQKKLATASIMIGKRQRIETEDSERGIFDF
jgi:hypothetical protein